MSTQQEMRRQHIPATLHQARHWYGTNVLRSSGGSIRVAQVLLRHRSIGSTEIYTQVVNDETAAAVLGLPELAA